MLSECVKKKCVSWNRSGQLNVPTDLFLDCVSQIQRFHACTFIKHFCMATDKEPWENDNEVSFRHTELHIFCHFLNTKVTFSIAVETLIPLHVRMSTFPASLLSSSHRDNTTCSQSVKPIWEFCQRSAQKLHWIWGGWMGVRMSTFEKLHALTKSYAVTPKL